MAVPTRPAEIPRSTVCLQRPQRRQNGFRRCHIRRVRKSNRAIYPAEDGASSGGGEVGGGFGERLGGRMEELGVEIDEDKLIRYINLTSECSLLVLGVYSRSNPLLAATRYTYHDLLTLFISHITTGP